MTTKNPKNATELNEEDLDAVTGGNGFFNKKAQLKARDGITNKNKLDSLLSRNGKIKPKNKQI